MIQAGDFEWLKGRIDDLHRKWEDQHIRDKRAYDRLFDALQRIAAVEADNKDNHHTVMRDIALAYTIPMSTPSST